MSDSRSTPPSDRMDNSGQFCAHLRISWRTEPCDGYSIRGEVMVGAGTRGWWECDSNCGAKFSPVNTVLQETIKALSAQVLRLGQCVDCGELDEQDGVRRGGKFYCVAHAPKQPDCGHLPDWTESP